MWKDEEQLIKKRGKLINREFYFLLKKKNNIQLVFFHLKKKKEIKGQLMLFIKLAIVYNIFKTKIYNHQFN